MRLFVVAGVALAMFASPAAFAQSLPSTPDYAPAPDPDTYGIASETSHTINSFEFEGYEQGVTIDVVFSETGRFVSAATGNPFLAAPVFLPSGASVTGIEIQGCNTSASETFLELDSFDAPGGGANFLGKAILAAGAGCAVSRANPTPFTINNRNNTYIILWTPDVLNNTQRLEAARIYYKLQVSPAPATATFTDVPTTHPFFQFVEALVASGITAGCAPGQYCPNAPLTRGQMAVFLARALGLHFTP